MLFYSDLSPTVNVDANFDRLLIPTEHPARSKSDTYYLCETELLRTHTSAHQAELLESGESSFLVLGDVYRKDEIDRSHYPVFHQIEGVHVFDIEQNEEKIVEDLIDTLTGVCNALFPNCETRVSDDYFPFTHPSFEIEVLYNGEWLEILGCGVVQPEILRTCSESNPNLIDENGTLKKGWAFGIGIDRLAMILFDIPDIRLMWVTDPKFTSQFKKGEITKFVPYSVLEQVEKDISFWIPDTQFIFGNSTDENYYDGYFWKLENEMTEIIREVTNEHHPDIVESVTLFDQFYHMKKGRLSRAYRIKFSPPDPSMKDGGEFNKLVNELHMKIGQALSENLELEIR